MTKEWETKKDSFQVVDVRKITTNFLPGLLKKAGQIPVVKGMTVIKTFEPIPLYSAMAALGFEHITDKVSDNEYQV